MKRSISLLFILLLVTGLFCLASEAVRLKNKRAPSGAGPAIVLQGTVGQQLFNGHARFRVSNVSFPAFGPKGEMPDQSGYFWFQVDIELKNGDNYKVTYGDSVHNLNIIDDQGRSYRVAEMREPSDWGLVAESVELTPGQMMKGSYVLPLPPDSVPVKMVFEPAPGWSHPVFRVNFPDLKVKAQAAAAKVTETSSLEGEPPGLPLEKYGD